MNSLNRESHQPLYIQLQNIIRQQIIEMPENKKIPSESELMDKYSVTRTTIRKAVDGLVNEGLLQRKQGKGVFIKPTEIKQSIWNVGSFSDMVRKKGLQPVSNIIKQKVVLIDGRSYFNLQRTRGISKNGENIWFTFENTNIPLDLFPKINKNYDFSSESLYAVMRHDYDIYPETQSIEMKGIIVDDRINQILDEPVGEALIKANIEVFEKKKREVERVEIIYSHRLKLHMLVGIS